MPHWSVMSFTVIFSKGFHRQQIFKYPHDHKFRKCRHVLPLLLCPKCEPELLLYVRAADMAIDKILDFCHIGNKNTPPDGGAAAEWCYTSANRRNSFHI